MDVGLKKAYTAVKRRPPTAHLANYINGTLRAKQGFGYGKFFQILFVHGIFIAIK